MPPFGILHYESFVTAIALFQVIPGPGTLTILRATSKGGIAGGMRAVAGTLVGDATLMLAAVLGLAAVLATFPTFFAALQWAGIAYLVWLGVGMLRAPAAAEASGNAPDSPRARYASQAFAVAMTNPKVIVFFMAFFPQFMAANAPRSTLGAMMLHVTGISLAYQMTLVLAGNAIACRLARLPGARRLAARLAGVALIGFGIRLAARRS